MNYEEWSSTPTQVNNISFSIKDKSFTTIIGENGSGKTTLAKILSGLIKTENVSYSSNKTSYCYNFISEKNVIKALKTIKKELIEQFNIDKKCINKESQQILNVLYSLSNNPDILILDDALGLIKNKTKIIKYLKSLKITIINITSDSEDLLYSDYSIIIKDKRILSGKPKTLLKNERNLKSIGLPFMIDLSNKLKLYDLLDEQYTDMDKMVDELWK